MTRILVDTNVLVSYLVDRSPAQQRQAAELIEAAADPERRLLLHSLVLSELAFVLGHSYRLERRSTSDVLRKLLDVPGAEPIDEVPWARLLELWPAQLPHFLDAALTAIAESVRPEAVATFDRAFARRLRARGIPTLWSSRSRA